MGSRPYPSRLPSTSAMTSAETPELMCTTVPPAKSSAPPAKPFPDWPVLTNASKPPSQTQWHSGQ